MPEMVPAATATFRKEQVLLRSPPPPLLPWGHHESPSLSSSEEDFAKTLDRVILARLELTDTNFAALTKSCQGAWPAAIADRLTANRLWNRLLPGVSTTGPVLYTPELHCGFGEWYFSKTTSQRLADEFLRNRPFAILLGTPTIARLAATMRVDFVLIDSNPFVGLRFPEVKSRLFLSAVEHLVTRFSEPSTIFLDAPWYLPKIKFWLTKASQLSGKATTIVMPLFRELTRPAARAERAIITEFARLIGKVDIIEDCVDYDSPLYEWEALISRGLCAHLNWRRADLLVITQPKPLDLTAIDDVDDQESWESFLIESQVVRLRIRPKARRKDYVIAPVAGCETFVFDSVSARDPRRAAIDVWSSRNRVAAIGNLNVMRYVLSILSASGQIRSHAEMLTRFSPVLTPPEAEMLRQFLSWETTH
jgi:hypothetical protein